jgi:subtilisin family serine protease
MPESYIILTANKAPKKLGFRSAAVEDRKFDVKVEKLEASQAEKIVRNNKEVVTIAPTIPIRLVKPLSVAGVVATTASAGPTWGVKAVKANTSRFTGKGVTVAVLDTGIKADHACFTGVQLIEEDFTGDGLGDTDGHGTHCAGTIFGRDFKGTRIGVAPGVERALIGKVIGENGGDSGKIVEAIQWALKEGAHIISMSLGIDFPGYVANLTSQGMPIEAATSQGLEAYRKNVLLFEKVAALVRSASLGGISQPALLIAASGNESRRPAFEISVAPPAVSDGFISVGALGQHDNGFEVADFSNRDPILSAPGVDILSASLDGGLESKNGTSMAAPHVAGVAALWAEKMLASGRLNVTSLAASLVALCSMDGLNGQDPGAIGAGMVQAPLQ